MTPLARKLADRRITPYLLLSYCLFLALLAVWGARVPRAVVQNISTLSPFVFVYAFAFVHLLLNMVLFWPAVRQRTTLDPKSLGQGIPTPLLPDGKWVNDARLEGFSVHWLEAGRRAVLVRNRWSPLGTVLLHGALLLLPVAYAVSRATRFEGRGWIVEGHAFNGTRGEYSQVDSEETFADRAPEVSFRVKGVDASFWGPRIFFTDLRASLELGEGADARTAWATLSKPLWVGGARISTQGFNYTPAFELVGPKGNRLETGDLNLRLFPAGVEDSFELPGLPHTVWVQLFPDSAGPRAVPLNRSQNLEEPLLRVRIARGKTVVRDAWVRPGDFVAFDGYRLSFPHIRRGGKILVHRDWGYPLLWVALVAGFLGAVLRMAFPSVRIWLLWEEGAARAVLKEDPFAEGRGRRWLERWGAHAD